MDLKNQYLFNQYQEKHGNKDRTPVSAADMESGASNALLGAEKVTRLDSPCRIHIHSKRHRLADADGICAKYVIDGLIHGGLLPNDSARWVKNVSFSQEKIGTDREEKTVVMIEVL